MKRKILLLFVLISGSVLFAQQDTIRTLMITEAFLGSPFNSLLEISNVGDEAIQLSNFELGRSGANHYRTTGESLMMLPDRLLQPGESFLISVYLDYVPYAYTQGIEGYGPAATPPELAEWADLILHVQDAPSGRLHPTLDSVSPYRPLDMYFGRQAVYLEQHFPGSDTAKGDSVIVDQVMGVFDVAFGDEGFLQNKGMAANEDAYDVAGFPAAGSYARLIRKNAVKQGNTEFVRGNSEDDSEWIALTNISGLSYRSQPWTLGNHGDYKLDENTLTSTTATVDFENKTITVPWGTLRPDGVMKLMDKKPGIAWYYQLSPDPLDSMAYGARTGDLIEIIVCGDAAERDVFEIIVTEPLASDNFVIPVANQLPDGAQAGLIMSGRVPDWPTILDGGSAIDTISGNGLIFNLGIPFGTRVDSLLERLEKPLNATWEIMPIDGNETRPDLLEGDKLKVTSESGAEKEYYIQVKDFEGSHDALLSSITWPDLPDPEFFEGIYGWKKDTIPNFRMNTLNYQLKLPPEINAVPATVVKPNDPDAQITVSKARNLGSYVTEDRTTVYTVTAEDDTTINEYVIEWQRENLPQNVQPFQAEPFVSEYIGRYYFMNDYLEICNPGTVTLDLSNYMIVSAGTTNPAEAIQQAPVWLDRYVKYVPGYRWVDSATWATNPGILEQDFDVNPLVEAGDVFCLSEITQNGWFGYGNTGWTDTAFAGIDEADVNFYNNKWRNPWNETVREGSVPIAQHDAGEIQYIFKILNDSILAGTKAANDPNDFELIEIIGNLDQTRWMFGFESLLDGHDFTSFIRLPEYVYPSTVLEESFGDPEAGIPSQWKRVNRRTPEKVSGWPQEWILTPMLNWGQHFFYPTTAYLSTISSNFYKVSRGYLTEEIEGVVTGTTVDDFLSKLDKADEGQLLVVKSTANGSELSANAAISLNDTLLVTSADGSNVTKYVLDVSAEGLSSDALLTSTEYTVTVDVEPAEGNDHIGTGNVEGMLYGTDIESVLSNLVVPEGASLTVLYDNGMFVPLNTLNYDTIFVQTTASDKVLLQVQAEDMVTTIVYGVSPDATEDDAMLYSDYLVVDQDLKMLEGLPGGISVDGLLKLIYSSRGASLQIVDKSGLERTSGTVRYDDKIFVTSQSGNTENTYFLSFANVGSIFNVYVVSDVYTVDNIEFIISDLYEETVISEFMSNLTISFGANAVVMDEDGNAKTETDSLFTGDYLRVASADESIVVEYSFVLDPVIGVEIFDSQQIKLYPNPSSGHFYVDGIQPGSQLRVMNITGAVIYEKTTRSNREFVSLEGQTKGVYIVTVKSGESHAFWKLINQ